MVTMLRSVCFRRVHNILVVDTTRGEQLSNIEDYVSKGKSLGVQLLFLCKDWYSLLYFYGVIIIQVVNVILLVRLTQRWDSPSPLAFLTP